MISSPVPESPWSSNRMKKYFFAVIFSAALLVGCGDSEKMVKLTPEQELQKAKKDAANRCTSKYIEVTNGMTNYQRFPYVEDLGHGEFEVKVFGGAQGYPIYLTCTIQNNFVVDYDLDGVLF